MNSRFKQLHLGDMEHGLAKEFALIGLSPKQITALLGITFELTRDGLDYCLAALLVTEDGRQFALRSYYRGPHPDVTELIGNERTQDPAKDVESFLQALSLPQKYILGSIADPGPGDD